MRPLDNSTDQNGYDIDLRPIPSSVYQLDMTADVSSRVTIPDGAERVLFGSNCNYWVKCGDSSVEAAHAGDVSDGSASECNPIGYTLLTGETHIAVISDTVGVVTMAFYAGNGVQS